MAVQLLSHEVSDLCLGKPPLRPLPVSSTVADALSLLRRSAGNPSISVWSATSAAGEICRCVGKLSIVDVLCFLCREDNLSQPSIALQSPLSLLLNKSSSNLVKQLETNSSLLDAVDCILEGAQSLIVPKRSRNSGTPKQKLLQKRQYCWITQEDVMRFFFNSINHFSAIASHSIQSLNIIEDGILAVHYDEPALSALSAINTAQNGHTAVAVLDDEGRLVGEISLYTLACCDESLAPAVATLSAGDLMAYIDYGGPPEDLVQLVKERLEERKLDGMLELLEKDHTNSSLSSSLSSSASSSSDDERSSLKTLRRRASSGGFVSGTEPIVCHPGSSLVAVMMQALAHRLNYVWVIEQDYSLVGMVTFAGMLKVFQDRVPSFS